MSEPMPSKNDKPATQADIHRLALAIARVDAKIDHRVDTLERRFRDLSDRIFSFFDPLAKKYEANNNAAALHGHALMEAQVQLKDLSRLESRPKA